MLTLTLQLFTESSNDKKGPERLSAPFIFLRFAVNERLRLRVITVAYVRPTQEVGLIHATCFFFSFCDIYWEHTNWCDWKSRPRLLKQSHDFEL